MDSKIHHYVDTSFRINSNWTRLVRHSSLKEIVNLVVLQVNVNIPRLQHGSEVGCRLKHSSLFHNSIICSVTLLNDQISVHYLLEFRFIAKTYFYNTSEFGLDVHWVGQYFYCFLCVYAA